ncbi:MAG: cell division protein ZapA [Bacteroidales bacterium]|jgi:cell division protein ZapA (FtsZ GTPase activity inhibitor)
MKKNIVVNLHINNRPYRLKASSTEEESFIRRAAVEVENLIDYYSKNARHDDMQDLLAMTAIHFASKLIKTEEENLFITNELSPKLKDLEKLVDQGLNA